MALVGLEELLHAARVAGADVIRWAPFAGEPYIQLVLYSTLERRAHGAFWCTQEVFDQLALLDGQEVILLRI